MDRYYIRAVSDLDASYGYHLFDRNSGGIATIHSAEDAQRICALLNADAVRTANQMPDDPFEEGRGLQNEGTGE